MTAINLFKTKDAAILLTDQAWMSVGCLGMVGSKVASEPKLSMAVAVNGAVSPHTIIIVRGWLSVRQTQAEAMGRIGELLQLVRDEAERTGQHAEPKPSPAKLFIALWHPDNGPECYLIDTAITSVRHCDSPPSKLPFPAPDDRSALIARIEDQRRQKCEEGYHNIGAAAELTMVTATGIKSDIIHRWPDRIGEPITP